MCTEMDFMPLTSMPQKNKQKKHGYYRDMYLLPPPPPTSMVSIQRASSTQLQKIVLTSMLWFSFILGLHFLLFWLKFTMIIIHYQLLKNKRK